MNDWLEDTKIWSFIDQTGFVANQISAPFWSTQKLFSIVHSAPPEHYARQRSVDCFVLQHT